MVYLFRFSIMCIMRAAMSRRNFGGNMNLQRSNFVFLDVLMLKYVKHTEFEGNNPYSKINKIRNIIVYTIIKILLERLSKEFNYLAEWNFL